MRSLGTLGDMAPVLASMLPPKPKPVMKAKPRHIYPGYDPNKHTHICNGNGVPHRWTVFAKVPQCPHKQIDTITGAAKICPVNVQCPSHGVGDLRQ